MSLLKRVFYKTPIQRFSEISLIIGATLGSSIAFHGWLPDIKLGYPVVASFALALLLIPRVGNWLLARRGGLTIAATSRTRRYLDELGPLAFRQPGPFAFGSGVSRRTQSRGLFRDMT